MNRDAGEDGDGKSFREALEELRKSFRNMPLRDEDFRVLRAGMERLERSINNMHAVSERVDAIREEIIKPVVAKMRGMERAGWVGLWVGLLGLVVTIFDVGDGMWTKHQLRANVRSTAIEQHVAVSLAPPAKGQFVFGNNIGGIALSPDGRWIAFVASTDRARLWVRRVDNTDGDVSEHALQKTEGAAYPFWSPDSKSIGFFADGKLKRVELAGEDPQIICTVAFGRGATWTEHGEIIFGTLLSGLSKVSASGNNSLPTPLTVLNARRGETGHSWPQMLPDDRMIYWVRSDDKDNEGVYATSLANPTTPVLVMKGTETNAVFAHGADGRNYLLWLREGELWAQPFDDTALATIGNAREIASPVSMIGLFGRANLAIPTNGLLLYAGFNTLSQFAWYWQDGTSIRRQGEPGQYTTFRISPKGGRIVASTDKPGGTDLRMDVQAQSTAIISDRGMNAYPVWSPDGRMVLYTSSHLNLLLKGLEGTESSWPLTRSPNAQYATDWSKDGKSILYWEVSPDKARRQLWVLHMDGANPLAAKTTAVSYMRTGHNDSWGRFSPEANPEWVAYESDASGRNEIYLEQFPQPTGNPIRVSLGGGQYPAWNPNGHEIFYVSPDYKFMAVALKRRASSIAPDTPREIFQLPSVDIGWPPYDVDPETGRILVRATIPDQPAKPLTLIVNWTLLP